MSVYKRGRTYWFKFLFQGQLIRESAKTNSKTVAREAERARRRELELAVNEHFVYKLIAEFGRPLICDIAEQEIADLRQKRLGEGKSPRTVDLEVNTLRQILKKHRLWGAIADRVSHLREPVPRSRADPCTGVGIGESKRKSQFKPTDCLCI